MREVEKEWRDKIPGIAIRPFDEVAEGAFRSEWDHSVRPVDWDWPVMVNAYRESDPIALAVAVWVYIDEEDCGFLHAAILARSGRQLPRDAIRITELESHPFKRSPVTGYGIQISLDLAFRYAEYTGMKAVEVEKARPELVDYLVERVGFRLRGID